MIKLKVEEYCQDCPHFDPEASHPKPTVRYLADQPIFFENNEDIIVRCEHESLCRHLSRHIREKMMKE